MLNEHAYGGDMSESRPATSTLSDDDIVRALRASVVVSLPTLGEAPVRELGLIYTRNSAPKQDSLEAQAEACRTYAENAGIEVPARWVFGEKRSGLDSGRPEYRKVMDLARAKRIKHVIVFMSDRFGRDSGTFIQDMRALEQLGVRVHTHLGEIEWEMVPFLAMCNEMSSRHLSLHVANKQRDLVARGAIISALPFGYTQGPHGDWEIDEENAMIIREMFSRLAQGCSLKSVTRWFSERLGKACPPILTKTRMQNPIYMGIYRFRARRNGRFTKGKDDGGPLFCPARRLRIVEPDIWFAANRRYPTLPAHPGEYERQAGVRSPLAGLLFCARCTRIWCRKGKDCGNSVPVRLEGINHARDRGYCCRQCGRSRAVNHILPGIERCVFAIPVGPYVAQAIQHPPHGAADTTARLRRLQQKAEAIQQEKVALIRESADRSSTIVRLFAEEDIVRAKRRIDAESAAIEREMQECEADTETYADRDAALAWLRTEGVWAIYPTLPVDEQNEILKRCIAACYVDCESGKATIRWQPAIAYLLGAETTLFHLEHARSQPRRRGVPSKLWLPYGEARILVQTLGIRSKNAYKALVRRGQPGARQDLPTEPERTYGLTGEWEGWSAFLGVVKG